MANQAHEATLKALLEIHGLSQELVTDIANPLSRLDNNSQDQLIEKLACHYAKNKRVN